MFQRWRLQLRQAQQAIAEGHLDEASRLLGQNSLKEFLPGQRLAARLGQQLLDRGRQRAALGDTSAGWRDLASATDLGAADESAEALRRQLVYQGLSETRAYLAAGDGAAALARLERIELRHIALPEVRRLKQVAKYVDVANRLSRKARFGEADSELTKATALAPDLTVLEDQRRAIRVKMTESLELLAQLHAATATQQWQTALVTAERLLELSPECPIARDARRKAWAVVGTKVNDSLAGVSVALAARAANPPNMSTSQGDHNSVGDTVSPHDSQTRFILWVDAVGGFLVCLSHEIVLGQPVANSNVDVPILADLSRRHAVIRRDDENYVIDPVRQVHVNGHEVTNRTLLGPGSLIQLGDAVRLNLLRPHPLSATGRLDFASRHRTQPPVDAVLLMAETCVLGPGASSHVVCPRWTREVVLYRQEGSLFCRANGNFEIDGVSVSDFGRISDDSKVRGDGFSFTLEALK